MSYSDAEDVKLPTKTVHKHYFTLSKEEKFLHEHYLQQTQKTYTSVEELQGREKSKRGLEAHVGLLRVCQISSAPYLITPGSKKEAGSEDMMKVNCPVVFPTHEGIDQWIKVREGPAGIHSSKMKTFVDFMDGQQQREVKTVVFANFTSTLRLGIEALGVHNPGYKNRIIFVHGGLNAKMRSVLFTRFRTDPDATILMMSLKVGSVGLNLTEASSVVFLESWWSPSSLLQGEARVHRIGQDKEVDVHYFLGRDSVEERIYGVAMAKKKLAQETKAMAADHDKLDQDSMKRILFNCA